MADGYNSPMPYKRAAKIYDEAMLYEYAVGALSRKMRTVAELKRLMREKVRQQGEEGQLLVKVVIAKLKKQRVTPGFAARTRSSGACAWCRT